MKQEPVVWDEEEFSGRAHTYRTWPAYDIKGVYDRFDELLNYVKKFTAPRELSDEEINLQSWMLGYQEGKASVLLEKELLKKAS